MAECPRCHQPVKAQAVTCPVCQFHLKAFGHPGIPLHRAAGDEVLCTTCLYHEDDSCNYPQRPFAKDCILYQNVNQLTSTSTVQPQVKSSSLLQWCQQHLPTIVIGVLLLVSLLLSLL